MRGRQQAAQQLLPLLCLRRLLRQGLLLQQLRVLLELLLQQPVLLLQPRLERSVQGRRSKGGEGDKNLVSV